MSGKRFADGIAVFIHKLYHLLQPNSTYSSLQPHKVRNRVNWLLRILFTLGLAQYIAWADEGRSIVIHSVRHAR